MEPLNLPDPTEALGAPGEAGRSMLAVRRAPMRPIISLEFISLSVVLLAVAWFKTPSTYNFVRKVLPVF